MKLAALLALAACNTADVVVGTLQEVAVVRAVPNHELDLLLVVDNSPSMADKQRAFAAALPWFLDELAHAEGGMPSLHVGVVTTDLGSQGSIVPAPGPAVGTVGKGGCAGRGDDGALRRIAALPDPFVVDIDHDGDRARNFTGELADLLAQLVQPGETGCGFEQPLAAMRRALVQPANAAMFRPDANLAVVFVTDEDDCSFTDPALLAPDADGPATSFRCFQHAVQCSPDDSSPGARHGCAPRERDPLIEPLQNFSNALFNAQHDPRKLLVAALAGDPSPVAVVPAEILGPALAPSCTVPGDARSAQPAVRLTSFVEGYPLHVVASICNADPGSALSGLAAATRRLIGEPCLDSRQLIDTSADDGMQPACQVLQVNDSSPWTRVALPRCAGVGDTQCYDLLTDPDVCRADDAHLRVTLQGSFPADAWIHVRCQHSE